MEELLQEEASDREKNRILPGVLYLVATPIGNLSDLSPRALKTLKEVDFIAAEDTRNSAKLLMHFGIRKELVSYFEHNKRQRGDLICRRLQAGEACALITDAGTPAISDPGEDVVRLCAQAGIPVSSVPGCCAAVNALALSGLPTGRFVFEGFLPADKGERRARLAALGKETRTAILYESPHHLCTTLSELAEAVGDRPLTLCREMTKLNEDIDRTTVLQAVEEYKTRQPRGEYVLVLGGGRAEGEENPLLALSVEEHVAHYIAAGMKKMDAIKAVARDRGVAKNEIYRAVNIED